MKCITIVPNKKWGGQGLIGCEFGKLNYKLRNI